MRRSPPRAGLDHARPSSSGIHHTRNPRGHGPPAGIRASPSVMFWSGKAASTHWRDDARRLATPLRRPPRGVARELSARAPSTDAMSCCPCSAASGKSWSRSTPSARASDRARNLAVRPCGPTPQGGSVGGASRGMAPGGSDPAVNAVATPTPADRSSVSNSNLARRRHSISIAQVVD